MRRAARALLWCGAILLGVPAISSETEGDQAPTLEASAKGLLVAMRSSSLEVTKALAAKAIARLP